MHSTSPSMSAQQHALLAATMYGSRLGFTAVRTQGRIRKGLSAAMCDRPHLCSWISMDMPRSGRSDAVLCGCS
jgi:hypothetical protein